ncbi:MAG: LCP family protein [Candidatus Limnocylindrales bacterium]|jgi:LCP family protein required for cell wall assembly
MRRSFSVKSPAGAAVLSFLLPGLGQAGAGRRRRGLFVALPALGMLVAAAGVVLLARRQLYDAFFSESTLSALVLLNVVVLLYRLWTIVDAYLIADSARLPDAPDSKEQTKAPARRSRRPLTAVVLGAVLVATIGTHLALGAVTVEYRDTLSCIFNVDAPCWFGGNGNLASGETAAAFSNDPGATDPPTASATATSSASDGGLPSLSPSNTPTLPPTPGPTTAAGIPIFPVENVSGPNTPPAEWSADGKLNVLLVGADEGVGRWSLRTDTMILLEVDIATGRSVMYGIPRNLENVPLPPESANAFSCHCFPYPNLLNALWRDAVNRPGAYPYAGSDFVRGFSALEGAIGQYLGLHVDGAVVINLMGFVNLINALGGLDIYVPAEVKDTQYSRPQDGKDITIDIKPGQQHMDGFTALAYARSRHQDSDYGRMSRQQAVLLALRAQLHPCSLLPKVPELISALGSAFWTDMPIADAPTLLALAERVGTSNVKSIELVPAVTGNTVGFLTIPRWMTVRNIVAHGLDGVPPASGGSGGSGGGGGLSC